MSPEELAKDPRAAGPRRKGAAVLAFGPLALYVATIFYKGTSRGVDAPFDVSDKTLHAVSFGGMVVFALPAVRYFWRGPTVAAQIAAAVALSSFAGAALEFWQWFLPYRTADAWDWAADTGGALAVGVALRIASRWFFFGTRAKEPG